MFYYIELLRRIRRTIIFSGIIFLLPVILVLSLYTAVQLEWIDELPTEKDLQNISNPMASEIYAGDSILIGKFFSENRSKLEFFQLNDFYKDALIATEDIRFYKHRGVDYQSLVRVFFKSILLQREGSGGGSTLTQQLVKNLFPRKKYKLGSTVLNKFREMAIARKLEKIYNKEEIIVLYSNTVSFGEGAYGLNTAAKRFFNKKPENLLLEEAATLVGMLKATTFYSPRKNPERARKRRNVVLSQMAKYDFIKESTAEEISKLPLHLNYQSLAETNEFARYFKQFIKREFNEWSRVRSKDDGSKYNLYRDGLKIYTSLDFDMQVVAEQTMVQHMAQLQKLFDESWKGGKKYGSGTRIIDDYILRDPYYKALKASGSSNSEALNQFTTHEMRRLWTWDGYEQQSTTKIDSIKHYLSLLHAGILAAEPSTGQIKIYVGGNDYARFQWDNVVSPRQAGSAFKPIVYLAALEGGVGACDYYKNELRTYSDYQDWTPKNANEEYGGYMPVFQALTHSVNTVSVQLLFDASIPKVVQVARELGVESPLSEFPSIVLGTSDVSLFEMVQVYSVLANRGEKIPLKGIVRIEDSNGNILFDMGELSEEMIDTDIDPEKIDTLNAILNNVTKSGTGRRLYSGFDIPQTVSGKTGTTQNQSDGWFIGFTNDLVVGAWVGAQDRRIHFRNLSTGAGGRTALPLVGAIFEYANDREERLQSSFPEIDFECPEFLTEEEYEFIQQRQKDTDISDLYHVQKWNLNPTKRDREMLSEEERKLAKEREKRLKKYLKARKRWERKLRRMQKKQ